MHVQHARSGEPQRLQQKRELRLRLLTDAEREAVNLFAKYEGLLLDPVYTGRAAAGMIDLIRKGFFKKDETVLFWHTGGQPALFADKYANKFS